jgi:TRAP-type C4-dicarboxylate transport system permease small subunit
MVHSFEDAGLEEAGIENPAAAVPIAAGLPYRILANVNNLIMIVSSIALVIAACILTYGVITRYFLHFSTDWQDEMSVFLIVGSIFMSSAAVQARRGHVAIEALSSILPDNVNRWRLFFVDVATFLFCAFFAWKSARLLEEAIVEGFRSSSTWQPPLWIPYSLMTAGMTLLSIQVLFQIVIQLRRRSRPA